MKINNIKILMAAIAVTISIHAKAGKLVDAETKTALPLASITDRHGNLVGMTSRDGEIPSIAADRFPLTFSYMGYKPLEVLTLGGSDVMMYQSLYELPEVAVSSESRPLLHQVGYMREVASLLGSSDSLTVYRESIVDFLTPVGKTKEKGWSKPRLLASRTYVKMSDSEGLDSVSAELDEEYLLWGDKFALLPPSKSIPNSIKNPGKIVSDTVMGKYSPKHIWLKNGATTRWYADGLADKKGHVYTPWLLKVAGMISDFKEASFNYVFHTDEGDIISPTDMTRVSLSAEIIVRGKLAKKAYHSTGPLYLRTYVEVYLTDREYLTETDAKAVKKEAPGYMASDVKAPADASPLHPGISRIVERAEALPKKENTKNDL